MFIADCKSAATKWFMTGGSFDGVSGEVVHTAGGVGIDPEVASSGEGHPEEEQNPKGGFSQRHASFPHFLTCFQVE